MNDKLLRIFLGPFYPSGVGCKLIAILCTIVLTLLTQVGGLILWPLWGFVFEGFQNENPWIRFIQRAGLLFVVYALTSLVVLPVIASQTGRQRLPLYATDALANPARYPQGTKTD